MSRCSINICWKDYLFSIKFPLLFFSKFDRFYLCRSISGLFILLHGFICLFFCQYHTILINVVSMNYNVHVDLCNQHNNQHMEQFHHSKKKINFLVFSPYTHISYPLMSGNHQSIFQHSNFSFL